MPTLFHHALLARARLDLGLTQDEAAAAAGMDVRTYRRYESGEVNDPVHGFAVRHPSRRRILQRLAAELGLAEDELLVAAVEPAPAPAPPPADWMALHVHALPRAHHFVGREAVLGLLRAWREATAGGVMALVALGGAGKTSVAARFLEGLGDGPHPGGLFVWSFYDDPRVEAFFEQALAYLAPASVPTGPGDRVDALQAALRGGAHLLVLDGLEIVQGTGAAQRTYGRVEDPPLRRFLTSAARGLGRSRCLVTSRFELTDLTAWEGSGLCTVRLGALEEPEGLALLAGWGLAGGRAELASLIERVRGHALSVAMIGSYAGAFLGGDLARAGAIDLEPAARDDPAARRLLSVLSTYAGALAPEERDLVARLSLFPSGASLDVLEAIAAAGGPVAGALAGLARAQLTPILARLERLGLVSVARAGARYATHPFLGQYFQSLLGVPPERIHQVTRDSLAARLDAHRAGPTEAALLDAYEELLLHTARAGRLAEAFEIYQRSLGGFGHLGLRLGEMSRGARVLRTFLPDGDPALFALAPPALPAGLRARVAYDLGLYAGALGDLAFAARCYRAHNDLSRAGNNLPSLATGLRTLAYTERLAGALDDALALAGASIDLATGLGLRADVVRGVALRASILHDLGRVAEAAAAFAEVRHLGDEPFARRGLWEAEHALDLGRVEEARVATARNLAVCRELGWEGHAAHGHTLLGLAALREAPANTEAARGHLEAARRWTAATGEVEVVLRCLMLEARIALAEGRVEAAEAVVAEGKELSESAGFGLFARRFAEIAVELRGSPADT